MTTKQLYIPVLKAKKGEFDALATLNPVDAHHVLPLMEVQPIPPADRPTIRNPDPQPREPQAHLTRNLATPLAAAWAGRELLLDVDAAAAMPAVGGQSAVAYALHAACAAGLEVIPVARLSQRAAVHRAITAAVAIDQRGVAVRLVGDDFGGGGPGPQIAALLQQLQLSPAEVDLVLDMGAPGQSAAIHAQLIATLTGMIPQLAAYRSFTVVSGAFPDSLTLLPVNSVSTIARTDWRSWLEIHRGNVAIPRTPRFGDFGANGPSTSTTAYRGTPNIRYTSDDDWLVFKGAGTDDPGAQYARLAAQVRAHALCRGGQHCNGNAFVQGCSPTRPGNATQWRMVATNHHMTVSACQLAALYGLPASGPP